MRLEILSACPDFIRDFLTYNETIKGKSSKSVEQYYSDLRTFFRYMLLVRGKAQPGIPFNKIDICYLNNDELFFINDVKSKDQEFLSETKNSLYFLPCCCFLPPLCRPAP